MMAQKCVVCGEREVEKGNICKECLEELAKMDKPIGKGIFLDVMGREGTVGVSVTSLGPFAEFERNLDSLGRAIDLFMEKLEGHLVPICPACKTTDRKLPRDMLFNGEIVKIGFCESCKAHFYYDSQGRKFVQRGNEFREI